MKRTIVVAVAVALLLLGLLAWWFAKSGRANPASTNEPAANADGAADLHKCKKGASVVYTDEPCRSDQHEQAIAGGSVNVVEAVRPKVELPSLPADLPNVRALRGDPNEPTLKDKQIERAIGQ